MSLFSVNPEAVALARKAVEILWPEARNAPNAVRLWSKSRCEVVIEGESRMFTGLLAVQIGNVIAAERRR